MRIPEWEDIFNQPIVLLCVDHYLHNEIPFVLTEFMIKENFRQFLQKIMLM